MIKSSRKIVTNNNCKNQSFGKLKISNPKMGIEDKIKICNNYLLINELVMNKI